MKKYISLIILCLFLKSAYCQEYVIFTENTPTSLNSHSFTINKGEVLEKKSNNFLFFGTEITINTTKNFKAFTLPTSPSYSEIKEIIRNNPLSIYIEGANSQLLNINATKLKQALSEKFSNKNFYVQIYTSAPFNEKDQNGARLVNDTVLRQPLANFKNKYVRYAISNGTLTYPDEFIDSSTFAVFIPKQNAQSQPDPAMVSNGLNSKSQNQSDQLQKNPHEESSSKSSIDSYINYIHPTLEIIIIILILGIYYLVASQKKRTRSTSPSDNPNAETLENINSQINKLLTDSNTEFPLDDKTREILKNIQTQISTPTIKENKNPSSDSKFKEILEAIQRLSSRLPEENSGNQTPFLEKIQETTEKLEQKINNLTQELFIDTLKTLPSKEDIGKLASATQLEEIQTGIIKINTALIEKDQRTSEQLEKNVQLNKKVEELSLSQEKQAKELSLGKELINTQKQTIEELKQRLSDIPEGIVYLGNCQRFIRPYLDLLSYMSECEKKIIDIIQNSSWEDANKLKLLLAKYAETKPVSALIEWKGILNNLQINGMIIHPIKNDIEKESIFENKIKILKQKIFEQLFRPYLSALLIFIEEMRTANDYIDLTQRISINLKDCINKICSDSKMLDYNIIYFPMLQQIQGNDYSQIESRENPQIIKQYPALGKLPSETIIAIEKYAINLDNSVQEKTIIYTK